MLIVQIYNYIVKIIRVIVITYKFLDINTRKCQQSTINSAHSVHKAIIFVFIPPLQTDKTNVRQNSRIQASNILSFRVEDK